MKKNRRDFIKMASMAFVAANFHNPLRNVDETNRGGKFNMSGYAAPPLPFVRIGFIGLGNRGPAAVKRILHIEGAKVIALCDLRPEKVKAVAQLLKGSVHEPVLYMNGEEDWKNLCERDDIDLVYIATHWAMHTPMAVYAMNQGKHVCVEVPAAKTIEECWALVHASEKNRRHCMMLENTCYGPFEMLALNMARQGFFGDIIHCEGAYIHDTLEGIFSKEKYWNSWRLKENVARNGNLYPTHGLGALAQVMNLNRGDKMDYLVSVSGNDFMMNEKAKELAAKDSYYREYVGKLYRGNINTSTIRTSKGKTIMIQHDVTSPRPRTSIQLISGTKATALEYPEPARIATGNEWAPPEMIKQWEEQYKPGIVKKIGEQAKKYGGHGGMDFIMDWRTIDCLRNGLPLDQDVYDAALWSAVSPLSEWSVRNRSNSIDVPDFTRGEWKTNTPVDLSLEKGGSTKII
jgi:predicted dehydrogenase